MTLSRDLPEMAHADARLRQLEVETEELTTRFAQEQRHDEVEYENARAAVEAQWHSRCKQAKSALAAYPQLLDDILAAISDSKVLRLMELTNDFNKRQEERAQLVKAEKFKLVDKWMSVPRPPVDTENFGGKRGEETSAPASPAPQQYGRSPPLPPMVAPGRTELPRVAPLRSMGPVMDRPLGHLVPPQVIRPEVSHTGHSQSQNIFCPPMQPHGVTVAKPSLGYAAPRVLPPPQPSYKRMGVESLLSTPTPSRPVEAGGYDYARPPPLAPIRAPAEFSTPATVSVVPSHGAGSAQPVRGRTLLPSRPKSEGHVVSSQPTSPAQSDSTPGSHAKRKAYDTVASDSAKKRPRVNTALDQTSPVPRPDRTIMFDEVYQDGKAQYKHMIVRYPDAQTGDFYILKCEEHGVHFNKNPLHGAAKHLHSAQHSTLSKERALAVSLLGYKVLGCTTELAAKNNEVVELAFAAGYKPFNMNQLSKTERAKLESAAQVANDQVNSTPNKTALPKAAPQNVSKGLRNRDTGLTNPKPDQLYLGYWAATREYYPVMMLAWGDQGVRKILQAPPKCYRVDPVMRKITGWAQGYEDGGPLVGYREFPAMWFDDDRNIGWIQSRDLSHFDLDDPNWKEIRNFQQARDYYVTYLGQNGKDDRKEAASGRTTPAAQQSTEDVEKGDATTPRADSDGDSDSVTNATDYDQDAEMSNAESRRTSVSNREGPSADDRMVNGPGNANATELDAQRIAAKALSWGSSLADPSAPTGAEAASSGSSERIVRRGPSPASLQNILEDFPEGQQSPTQQGASATADKQASRLPSAASPVSRSAITPVSPRPSDAADSIHVKRSPNQPNTEAVDENLSATLTPVTTPLTSTAPLRVLPQPPTTLLKTTAPSPRSAESPLLTPISNELNTWGNSPVLPNKMAGFAMLKSERTAGGGSAVASKSELFDVVFSGRDAEGQQVDGQAVRLSVNPDSNTAKTASDSALTVTIDPRLIKAMIVKAGSSPTSCPVALKYAADDQEATLVFQTDQSSSGRIHARRFCRWVRDINKDVYYRTESSDGVRPAPIVVA